MSRGTGVILVKAMAQRVVEQRLRAADCRAERGRPVHGVGLSVWGAPRSRSATQHDQRRGRLRDRQAAGLSGDGMVAVKKYQAVARRDGRFWLVDVEGVGLTQGRNLHLPATWQLISSYR